MYVKQIQQFIAQNNIRVITIVNSLRMLIDSLHSTVGSHSSISRTLLHCNVSAVGGRIELGYKTNYSQILVPSPVC